MTRIPDSHGEGMPNAATGGSPASLEVPANDGFVRLGRRGWAFVGIVAASVILYVVLAALSGLVVPLVVAAVVGTLFVPLVDKLENHMPRKLASGLVLVGLVVVGVGAVVVAIAGVADQASEIRDQLRAGLESVRDWLEGAGVDIGSASELTDGAEDVVGGSVAGITTYLSTVFSSAAAFIGGTFVGLFILFYILADWKEFSNWVASHLGVPTDLGAGIVDDATWSIRRYFYALTLTSFVTAVVIGGAAAVIGVPLAFTIALVTFVTSYVPYVGAFVSGAFAVLIALGAGGTSDALIILAVILVVQVVIQPLLQNRMTASELDINPVVSFGSTIVGGVLAGVLGATLSAPVVAMIIKMVGTVKHYGESEEALETSGSTATP